MNLRCLDSIVNWDCGSSSRFLDQPLDVYPAKVRLASALCSGKKRCNVAAVLTQPHEMRKSEHIIKGKDGSWVRPARRQTNRDSAAVFLG